MLKILYRSFKISVVIECFMSWQCKRTTCVLLLQGVLFHTYQRFLRHILVMSMRAQNILFLQGQMFLVIYLQLQLKRVGTLCRM